MAEAARVQPLPEHDTFAFPRWNEARAAELASPPRWAPGRGVEAAAPVSSATAEPLVLPAPPPAPPVELFDQHRTATADEPPFEDHLEDDEPYDGEEDDPEAFFEPDRPARTGGAFAAVAHLVRAPAEEPEAAAPPPAAPAPAPRQADGRPDAPRGPASVIDLSRRRPARRPEERLGSRPDRIALWALFMGVLLALVAATSANAAPL